MMLADTSAAWNLPPVPAIVESVGRSGSATAGLTDSPAEERRLVRDAFLRRWIRGDIPAERGTIATPIEESLVDQDQRQRQAWERLFELEASHAVATRLAVLRGDAAADAEPYSETSERDLLAFLGAESRIRQPNIYLLDNGNLRAVWKNDAGDHVGLQFLGGDEVQFVIFKHRMGQQPARVAGRTGLDVAADEIAVMGVSALP